MLARWGKRIDWIPVMRSRSMRVTVFVISCFPYSIRLYLGPSMRFAGWVMCAVRMIGIWKTRRSCCASLVQPDGAEGYSLDRLRLQAQPLALQRRVLREVFRRMHPIRRASSLAAVEAVRRLLSPHGGGATHSIEGVHIRVTENALLMQPTQAVALPQRVRRASNGARCRSLPSSNGLVRDNEFEYKKGACEAVRQLSASQEWVMIVDADLLSYPLHIRS